MRSEHVGRRHRLWDPLNHSHLATLHGHGAPLTSVTFHPSGRYVIASSTDGTLCFWSVATGELVLTLFPRFEGWAAFTPDGRFKSDGDLDGMVWHRIGLVRFGLDEPLRVPLSQPLVSLD